MRMRRTLLLFLASFSFARACPAADADVLFIGNSFTSVNDLPKLLRAVAASMGDRIETDMYAPGSYTFEAHARNAAVQEKLKAREWTFVVLQEQSQRPTFPPRQLETYVTPFALRLDEMIRAAHASTKTVFFETWGYKNGDPRNCASVPRTCTYEGMQELLIEGYSGFAQRTSGMLAPVGAAWRQVRRTHPEIALYAGDGIHPSLQGSYLAACVFYSTLLRKGALGADPLGLEPSEARILQRAAQDASFHRPKER